MEAVVGIEGECEEGLGMGREERRGAAKGTVMVHGGVVTVVWREDGKMWLTLHMGWVQPYMGLPVSHSKPGRIHVQKEGSVSERGSFLPAGRQILLLGPTSALWR